MGASWHLYYYFHVNWAKYRGFAFRSNHHRKLQTKVVCARISSNSEKFRSFRKYKYCQNILLRRWLGFILSLFQEQAAIKLQKWSTSLILVCFLPTRKASRKSYLTSFLFLPCQSSDAIFLAPVPNLGRHVQELLFNFEFGTWLLALIANK